MEDKKQIYLDILESLDLYNKKDFLIYMALLNYINKNYSEVIMRGRSEPLDSYLNKIHNCIPELPKQGWEIPKDFKQKDFYSMNSLEEFREEAVRIKEFIIKYKNGK